MAMPRISSIAACSDSFTPKTDTGGGPDGKTTHDGLAVGDSKGPTTDGGSSTTCGTAICDAATQICVNVQAETGPTLSFRARARRA